MITQVIKYMNKFYEVDTKETIIKDLSDKSNRIYHHEIIEELMDMFDLEEYRAQGLLKRWVDMYFKGFDFETFRNKKKSLFDLDSFVMGHMHHMTPPAQRQGRTMRGIASGDLSHITGTRRPCPIIDYTSELGNSLNLNVDEKRQKELLDGLLELRQRFNIKFDNKVVLKSVFNSNY